MAEHRWWNYSGQRWNAYHERCSSRGQTDPQLCEIRRIFSSSELKLLSQNPGKHFITVATQLSAPYGPTGVQGWRKRDTVFIIQLDKDPFPLLVKLEEYFGPWGRTSGATFLGWLVRCQKTVKTIFKKPEVRASDCLFLPKL